MLTYLALEQKSSSKNNMQLISFLLITTVPIAVTVPEGFNGIKNLNSKPYVGNLVQTVKFRS
jgi:hypothetical protein